MKRVAYNKVDELLKENSVSSRIFENTDDNKKRMRDVNNFLLGIVGLFILNKRLNPELTMENFVKYKRINSKVKIAKITADDVAKIQWEDDPHIYESPNYNTGEKTKFTGFLRKTDPVFTKIREEKDANFIRP